MAKPRPAGGESKRTTRGYRLVNGRLVRVEEIRETSPNGTLTVGGVTYPVTNVEIVEHVEKPVAGGEGS